MKDFLVVVAAILLLSVVILLNAPVQQTSTQYVFLSTEESMYEVTTKIPAVDNEGKGLMAVLRVGMRPGTGKTLVDINQLLFWIDTQYSIQVAKKVAEKFTSINMSTIDLFYGIETDASVIEGPSAGAALTVATIAVLEGRQLNSSVSITGTINEDGSIGPVGGIKEKAKAAKEAGATLLLVPLGQSEYTTYRPVKTCEKIGRWTVCRTEYKKETISARDVGIDIKEVRNVEDALKYFLV